MLFRLAANSSKLLEGFRPIRVVRPVWEQIAVLRVRNE